MNSQKSPTAGRSTEQPAPESSGRRPLRLPMLLAPLAITGLFYSCGSINSHLYLAEQYVVFDGGSSCVSTPDAPYLVAVVDGGDTVFGCSPVCIVLPPTSDGGGENVYVSSECPPYPWPGAADASLPACQEALQMLDARYFCVGDADTLPPQNPPQLLVDGGIPDSSSEDGGIDAWQPDASADGGSEVDGSLDDAASMDGSMVDASSADASNAG